MQIESTVSSVCTLPAIRRIYAIARPPIQERKKKKKKNFIEEKYLVLMRIRILTITIISYSLSLVICIKYLQIFFKL